MATKKEENEQRADDGMIMEKQPNPKMRSIMENMRKRQGLDPLPTEPVVKKKPEKFVPIDPPGPIPRVIPKPEFPEDEPAFENLLETTKTDSEPYDHRDSAPNFNGDDSGDEFIRTQPRDISHYLNRASTLFQPSSSAPAVDDDEFERHSHQSINDENDDVSSDDEPFRAQPRPLSHYLKAASSASNNGKRYASAFDHDSYDEDNDEPECADFHYSPEPLQQRPKHSEITLNPALQDHEEVNYEEKFSMGNEDGSVEDSLALPNQAMVCSVPHRCVKVRWPANDDEKFNKDIRDVLNAFRNSKCSKQRKPPSNLVITDSMMSSIAFQTIYQNTLKLHVGYPNDAFNLVEQMKAQIDDKENDYVIKNILLCIGFDYLVYYPDIEEAIKDTITFFNRFLRSIVKAFDKNGPKRYKHVNLDELMEEPTPIPILPPRIIIVTIPQIKKHLTALTYNIEIDKMNTAIRKYVQRAKDSVFRDHNVVLELYDWAELASEYDRCDKYDLSGRNRILTEDMAEIYTWLMVPSG